MKNLVRISMVFVLAFAAQVWVKGQTPAPGQQAAGQAQAGGQGNAPRYRGKPMPGNIPGNTVTVIPSGDVQSLLDMGTGDTPLRVVDASTGHFGVYALTYQPSTAPPATPTRAQYHSDTTEIYYVVQGTGTFLAGGELENATSNDPESRVAKAISGPGASGTVTNFKLIPYTAGMIIIVPPGVPHSGNYTVTTKTQFLIMRIDPNKKLDLK
jgi:uncharacterized RmlC-like cupin family protein